MDLGRVCPRRLDSREIWRQIVEDPALPKAAGCGPVWIWLGASSGLYLSKGLPFIDLASIFH